MSDLCKYFIGANIALGVVALLDGAMTGGWVIMGISVVPFSSAYLCYNTCREDDAR
ncbi:MAG: hypothetical protein GXO25_01695 [Euryarchaeota archaeon]|nr:hypothetical protein [Euryarchaeota archaeon]